MSRRRSASANEQDKKRFHLLILAVGAAVGFGTVHRRWAAAKVEGEKVASSGSLEVIVS